MVFPRVKQPHIHKYGISNTSTRYRDILYHQQRCYVTINMIFILFWHNIQLNLHLINETKLNKIKFKRINFFKRIKS